MEEATCNAVVLIPKGGGNYWGFVLMYFMWKTVTVILNRRLMAAVVLHDVLYIL